MYRKLFKNFMLFNIAFCLSLLPFLAHSTGAEANNGQVLLTDCRKMIQNLGNEAIKTLKGSKADRQKREEQFRPLFIKNFDVERIGKFVLGKYGRGSIKPDEFKEFLEIFQRTIVSIYAKRLGNYDDEKFIVGDANFSVNEPQEKIVTVKSQVVPKDRGAINIVWTIVIKNDRKGIVDVTIEGVSQAFTQRQEYGDTLKNGGIRELIKKLKEKYEANTNKPTK